MVTNGSKAPSTPAPIPYGKTHPCTEHKVIREKLSKLESAIEKTEARRWSLVIVAVGSIVCIVIAIVTMGLYFGEMATTLDHVGRNEATDRIEMQRLRNEMIGTERKQNIESQKLLRSMTKLDAKLEGVERRLTDIEAAIPRRWMNRPR